MNGMFFSPGKVSVIVLLLIVVTCTSLSAQEQTVGLFKNDTASFTGYTLFTQIGATTTHLIDVYGRLVHSWQSDYNPNLSVYLLPNGNLLRTAKVLTAAGTAVQQFGWDGEELWYYEWSEQHHDIEPLPNGNVLILTGDYITSSEAIDAGRDPALIDGTELKLEQIIEIEPVPPTGGNIVWEWSVRDHLIQDFDPSKANYGVVEDHPELIDFNFAQSGAIDWIHANAVAYNPVLDQIIISSRVHSEVWVIDHSTTLAEVEGHTGGQCGMGGDILYRWGNPLSYRAGATEDQQLYHQHDARWIPEGCPGAGNILVFNNDSGSPEEYSSVDEIDPPLNEGTGCYPQPAPGIPHGPADKTWVYTADTPADFYAPKISGAQRLPNGNTLICSGRGGWFFEVSQAGAIVWDYVCPVSAGTPLHQGDPVIQNNVFRCHRYAPDYAAFEGRDLTPGGTIEIYDVTISGTAHSPLEPTSSDSVIFTAEITSASSIVVAELLVDTGNGYSAVMMFDDGNHHDGLAGDDLYGGAVPPLSESLLVSYYVYGEETAGPYTNDPPNPPNTTYSFVVGTSPSCCIAPSVGDLDQSGESSPFNISGIDLSVMIDGLFINLDWTGTCLDEADLDFGCGRPCSDPFAIDGIDLSVLIDALFISLTPPPQCNGTPN